MTNVEVTPLFLHPLPVTVIYLVFEAPFSVSSWSFPGLQGRTSVHSYKLEKSRRPTEGGFYPGSIRSSLTSCCFVVVDIEEKSVATCSNFLGQRLF